jgi:hypothetical protein
MTFHALPRFPEAIEFVRCSALASALFRALEVIEIIGSTLVCSAPPYPLRAALPFQRGARLAEYAHQRGAIAHVNVAIRQRLDGARIAAGAKV